MHRQTMMTPLHTDFPAVQCKCVTQGCAGSAGKRHRDSFPKLPLLSYCIPEACKVVATLKRLIKFLKHYNFHTFFPCIFAPCTVCLTTPLGPNPSNGLICCCQARLQWLLRWKTIATGAHRSPLRYSPRNRNLQSEAHQAGH